MAPNVVTLAPRVSVPLAVDDPNRFAFTSRVLGGPNSPLVRNQTGNQRLYAGLAELYRALQQPGGDASRAAKNLTDWYESKKSRDPDAAEQGREAILAELNQHGAQGQAIAMQLQGEGMPVPEAAPEPDPSSDEEDATLQEGQGTQGEEEKTEEPEEDKSSIEVEGVSLRLSIPSQAAEEGLIGQAPLLATWNTSYGAQGMVKWRVGNFHLFNSLGFKRLRPYGHETAQYSRGSLDFGLISPKKPSFGDRGPDGSFHLGLFGDTEVGINLGVITCDEVEGGECPSSAAFEFGIYSKSTSVMIGYDRFSASMRFFQPSLHFVSSDDFKIPENNRDIFEISLDIYLTNPDHETEPTKPEDLLRKPISYPQFVADGADVFVASIINYYMMRTQVAYMQSFPFSYGNEDQYTLNKLGLFTGSLLNGFNEGSRVNRLGDIFRYGDTTQRLVLAGGLALELGVLGGIMAGGEITPNPDTFQTFPGEPAPTDLAYDPFGVQKSGAAYVRLVQVGVRDGLALAKGFLPFYDYNRAIQGGMESGAFWGAAATDLSLALGGCIAVLFGGDHSGDGLIGQNILGNKLPNKDQPINFEEGQYSFPSYYKQTLVTSIGAQACTSGVLGVLDLFGGAADYKNLKEKAGPNQEASEQGKNSSAEEESASAIPRINVSASDNGVFGTLTWSN